MNYASECREHNFLVQSEVKPGGVEPGGAGFRDRCCCEEARVHYILWHQKRGYELGCLLNWLFEKHAVCICLLLVCFVLRAPGERSSSVAS